MQALIEFITKNLLSLWPIARIYSWEQGLRVRGGVATGDLLKPGLHWRWWFIDQIYRMAVTDRTLDLLTPAVVLSDDRTIVASANVVWRITDVRTMWLQVNEVEPSMRNLALGLLASLLSAYGWAELRGRRGAVEQEMADKMRATTSHWGVEIRAVYLTDLAPAKVLRLVDGRD